MESLLLVKKTKRGCVFEASSNSNCQSLAEFWYARCIRYNIDQKFNSIDRILWSCLHLLRVFFFIECVKCMFVWMTNALAFHTIKNHALNACNFVGTDIKRRKLKTVSIANVIWQSTFPSIFTFSQVFRHFLKENQQKKISNTWTTLANCYLFPHIVYIVFNQIALNKIYIVFPI